MMTPFAQHPFVGAERAGLFRPLTFTALPATPVQGRSGGVVPPRHTLEPNTQTIRFGEPAAIYGRKNNAPDSRR